MKIYEIVKTAEEVDELLKNGYTIVNQESSQKTGVYLLCKEKEDEK